MQRRAPPTPSKMGPPPPRTESRPVEIFKSALEDMVDGMVVMNEGESLVAMFDDLESHWIGIKHRLHDTEDKMYTLACHFQTLQQKYFQMKERSEQQSEELQSLKKEKRAYDKRSDNLRSQLKQLEDAVLDRDEQIDHLTDVVNMCKDVILEQEDIRIPQDAKQNLIRAVSRTQSMKRPTRPLNRVEETFESDANSFTDTFDHTGDMLDGPSQTDVLEMSISRCPPTTAKRRQSNRHRRQSAEREQTKQEVADSFWAIKTPIKQPMKKQMDRPQSPNLATHNFARKRVSEMIMSSDCRKSFNCSILYYV